MSNTTVENYATVKPSTWRSVNYVLSPDFKLLKESLERYGWLSPIVVRQETKEIIDGYHRWVIASNDPAGVGRAIPVSWVSCDEIDAMILHITLNRARGEVINRDLSALLKRILRSKKYEEDDVARIFRMSSDEFDVLADGTLLKRRNIKKHEYSKAWVPVETKGSDAPIKIERPPNTDS